MKILPLFAKGERHSYSEKIQIITKIQIRKKSELTFRIRFTIINVLLWLTKMETDYMRIYFNGNIVCIYLFIYLNMYLT